jgi:flagellar motor protein MotB
MNESRKTIWVQLAVALFVAMLMVSTASAQKTKRKKATPPSPPPPAVTAKELKELNDAANQSRENLITASNTYRESLERLLALQKQDEKRVSELVEKRKELLDLGIVAKREVTEGEELLADAKAKSAETEKQLESVDNLVAEVNAAYELSKLPPEPQGTFRSTGMLVRFVGLSRWNLSDFGKVDAFYRLKFSKPLPVSAFGQSETHNRLGFDHSHALDVALHPDSTEGQALIEFLQNQGISFIAIRGAIPGSSTGAHIHIGPGSRRISIKP